jgi:hypothetical protein
MDQEGKFEEFKSTCDAEGLLLNSITPDGDDVCSGIQDDGTLLHVFLCP